MTRLADLPLHTQATLVSVGGARPVRRRLMELGLVPGTRVEVVGISPLGDPLQLSVRGCRISVRRKEAFSLEVER